MPVKDATVTSLTAVGKTVIIDVAPVPPDKALDDTEPLSTTCSFATAVAANIVRRNEALVEPETSAKLIIDDSAYTSADACYRKVNLKPWSILKVCAPGAEGSEEPVSKETAGGVKEDCQLFTSLDKVHQAENKDAHENGANNRSDILVALVSARKTAEDT